MKGADSAFECNEKVLSGVVSIMMSLKTCLRFELALTSVPLLARRASEAEPPHVDARSVSNGG